MLLEQKPEEASDGAHEGTAIPPFPHFCVFPYNSAKVSLSTPVLVAIMSSVSVSIPSLSLGILIIPKNPTRFSLPSHSSAISDDADRLKGVESN